jgi:hypothetical protein
MSDPQGFFADPVDDDGNVIGTVTNMRVTTSWAGEIPMTKIPHAEMALDPETTLHVRLEDMPEFQGTRVTPGEHSPSDHGAYGTPHNRRNGATVTPQGLSQDELVCNRCQDTEAQR